MEFRNRAALKQAARDSLLASKGDPKRIILIHTLVSLGVTFLLGAISFALEHQISNTGGLSGLGLRSVLSTAQAVLQIAQMALLPFWEAGYFWATMKMARREEVQPGSLLEGFRRFGPYLRLTLLRSLIFFGIGMISMYVGIQVFAFTPWGQSFAVQMMPLMEEAMVSGNMELSAEMMALADQTRLPLTVIVGLIYAALLLPVFYSYRMANYALLDAPQQGGMAALRKSRGLMRRNRVALFRLDLSFWWYYLAQFVLVVICYGDMLLQAAGLPLPWSETVSFFAFYIVSLILQFVLFYFCRNQVEVTYATAYEALRPVQTTAENNRNF